jgi:hypothetical protein
MWTVLVTDQVGSPSTTGRIVHRMPPAVPPLQDLLSLTFRLRRCGVL